MSTSSQSINSSPTFCITQVLDASIETVWKAWSDEVQLKEWFGPKGSPIRKSSMNFTEGGQYHYGLDTPDGGTMWGLWTFKYIEAPNLLVWQHNFTDAGGELITRHPYCLTWPLHMVATLQLKPMEQQTQLTMQMDAFEMNEEELATWKEGMDGMTQGWGGTFEQLAEFLGQTY